MESQDVLKSQGILRSQGDYFKVFISSTFKDLEDYRSAVIDQLNRMEIEGVKMEYFGSNELKPLDVCLQALEKCNIYIGIIGHCYGSQPPRKNTSFVQCEYMKALELANSNKMKIFLYIAGDEVLVPIALRESDDLHVKQKQFRKELKANHIPIRFNSPDDLAKKVSSDLYKARNSGNVPKIESNIFSANDYSEIEYYFDSLGRERQQRIQSVVDLMIESFEQLFYIDRERLDDHLFFKKIKEQLLNVIPGIILDDTGGVLNRTGVRHVILRTETASILLKAIKDKETNLSAIGEEIGTTAARDLVTNTIEDKQLIPDSPESLIALWNFWDRTGGWGKLSIQSRKEDFPNCYSWRIMVENNFMKTTDLEENHELCYFWCGYIKGFLNYSLTSLSNYVATKLRRDEFSKVKIPQYIKVTKVEHDKSLSKDNDYFNITLESEYLRGARRYLMHANGAFKSENYSDTANNLYAALLYIKNELETEDYKNEFNRLSEEDQKTVTEIYNDKNAYVSDKLTVEKWLRSMSTFCNNVLNK